MEEIGKIVEYPDRRIKAIVYDVDFMATYRDI